MRKNLCILIAKSFIFSVKLRGYSELLSVENSFYPIVMDSLSPFCYGKHASVPDKDFFRLSITWMTWIAFAAKYSRKKAIYTVYSKFPYQKPYS
jgi:hypothetical protein